MESSSMQRLSPTVENTNVLALTLTFRISFAVDV
jgi:hypothetical protein